MTIAVCYLSPEGFVVGSDSTTTYGSSHGPHYFNHAQKIFEIGENSSLALVTWGLGSIGFMSHRLLVAQLGDDLRRSPPASVNNVMKLWIDKFWEHYRNGAISAEIDRTLELDQMLPFIADQQPPVPGSRSREQESELDDLKDGLVVGFCLGGYVDADRTPAAEFVIFEPHRPKPSSVALPLQSSGAWGAPAMMQRLIRGFDERLPDDIIKSGKWIGSASELNGLLMRYPLNHPILPIRDAVDYVYTCVYSTIKAYKFSNLSQICGGPIEIAVITADRRFRWVRHKLWDSAITDGEP